MISGIFTTVLLIVFLGIVIWAYSSKRRRDFDEAANLPFQDEKKAPQRSGSNNRGERS